MTFKPKSEKVTEYSDSFKKATKKLGRMIFKTMAIPLLSLSLASCPSVAAKKPPEKIPPEKIPPAKTDDKATGKTVDGKWGGGGCVFNESEWSITYKSNEEINGSKEAKIELDRIGGVGSPEKIVCGDIRSYLITPNHVIITLGALRAFEGHFMLGPVGEQLIFSSTTGLDISPISEQGILLSLVVFDYNVTSDESGIKLNINDRLYLFTQFGEVWEVPLTNPTKASSAFTAKYPPMGNVAMTTYKGLVVLAKEGDENVVLIESTRDKFITLTNEKKDWVKGEISFEEEKDCMKVKVGEKEFAVKVPEEGKAGNASVEENVYKEENKIQKW